MQSGVQPTVLQQLCQLPFPYFSEPRLSAVLFPTLLACCCDNAENRAILEQELSFDLLEGYRLSAAADGDRLVMLLRDPKEKARGLSRASSVCSNGEVKATASVSSVGPEAKKARTTLEPSPEVAADRETKVSGCPVEEGAVRGDPVGGEAAKERPAGEEKSVDQKSSKTGRGKTSKTEVKQGPESATTAKEPPPPKKQKKVLASAVSERAESETARLPAQPQGAKGGTSRQKCRKAKEAL
ncbi:hypothetical protein FOCC_FOCC003672 [Frankliniella occidentalis]|nr:hypothetical protein FOCC_FOCC003672 [Frankliniella occidentalis]